MEISTFHTLSRWMMIKRTASFSWENWLVLVLIQIWIYKTWLQHLLRRPNFMNTYQQLEKIHLTLIFLFRFILIKTLTLLFDQTFSLAALVSVVLLLYILSFLSKSISWFLFILLSIVYTTTFLSVTYNVIRFK